ncbi:unnamed protein product [Lampetra fluviatilis]
MSASTGRHGTRIEGAAADTQCGVDFDDTPCGVDFDVDSASCEESRHSAPGSRIVGQGQARVDGFRRAAGRRCPRVRFPRASGLLFEVVDGV